MTGNQNPVTVVSGATTTTASVAVLPNTGGNTVAFWLTLLALACGVLVLSSFVGTRLYRRFNR